jgi:hypothetical protein
MVAPPFVAYSALTRAIVPADAWPAVYAALQAYKGHVQEYPGCQRFEALVRVDTDGVLVHCYSTWDTPVQLEAFLERGYTVERLLADIDDLEPEESLVMEKIF